MTRTRYTDRATIIHHQATALLDRSRMAQAAEAPQLVAEAAQVLTEQGRAIDRLRAAIERLGGNPDE